MLPLTQWSVTVRYRVKATVVTEYTFPTSTLLCMCV